MVVKNQKHIKQQNRREVLEMIIKEGPISKSVIAKNMNMSPTSSTRIVNYLLHEGLIIEDVSNGTNKGKRNLLSTNQNNIFNISAEVDIDSISLAVINLKGKIILKDSIHIETLDEEKVADILGEEIVKISKNQIVDGKKIMGVGIAIPGIINFETGTVKISTQFNWENVPFAKMIQEKTGYEVLIDNELKLKALAENYYSSERETNLVMVGFGNGVGSALVTEGEIYRGSDNASGEIGHITLDPMGPRCTCGKYGCLQTYIAKDFLLADARMSHQVNDINELVELAESGQVWAIGILDKAISYMLLTLNNLMRIYNPSVIYISGSLIENHSYMHHKLSNSFGEVDAFRVGDLKIFFTHLKEEGALIGAALECQRKYIENLE